LRQEATLHNHHLLHHTVDSTMATVNSKTFESYSILAQVSGLSPRLADQEQKTSSLVRR
jgi:hypothetical protein